MNGGRWVMDLKIGTASSAARPSVNMMLRSTRVVVNRRLPSASPCGTTIGLPRSMVPTITSGISKLTKEGKNTPLTMATVVTRSAIHNMVVVTSPIGDHAPPAFAASTTTPAIISRSPRSLRTLRSSEIITIVVVRLSRTALRKNVTKPMIQTSDPTVRALIRVVMTSKPSCPSITSTMVIAPIRKKAICAVLISDSSSCSSIAVPWPLAMA